MTSIYIDGLSVPHEIKVALKELSQNISFTQEITKGANGHLFLGRNLILDTLVAVKFYYWGNDKAYHAEPRNLAAIKADNILTIHDAAQIDNDWAYFVTPYCSNGDLDDYLEKTCFGNIEAIELISGVLSGLSYLHANDFLHRDLKPSNIYIADNGNAVIGDFGSLKVIPEGESAISASSLSSIYRPPEAVRANTYCIQSDIYQLGVVLYQLLGGHLPYDEYSWMSKPELKHFNLLTDPVDRSIFVDQCIKGKIVKGKVVNMNTLPPWVPQSLKRVLRRAVNVDPSKRFQNTADFRTELHKLRVSVLDWAISGGIPTLRGKTSYQILDQDGQLFVKKRRNGDWRKDNSIMSKNLADIVREIQSKV